MVALLILIPSLFARDEFIKLGTLYAFGSLLSFIFAHASVLSLRIKNPDWHRPFKLGPNIKFRQWELPVSAIFGLIGTAVIWFVVIFTQPYSRWVGLSWMVLGLVIYLLFRWLKKLPLSQRVKTRRTIRVRDRFRGKRQDNIDKAEV